MPAKMTSMPGSTRRRRGVPGGIAAMAVVVLAGCGTTVRGSASAAGAVPPDLGSSSPHGSPAAPMGTPASITAGTAGAARAAARAAGPDALRPSDSTGMNGRSAAPRLGKPYTVGLIHSTSAQAALRLLGSTADTGDVRAEGNAVIAYLNAHGGLGGRRLVASWYDANAQDDPSTIAERACASWTQDDHVDAAVPGLPIVDMSVMRACLRRTSTPAVSADYHVQTRRSGYAQNPHWLEPMQLSMESYAKTYVDSLAAQGFFKGGRLGIIHDDGNDWTAVERTVLEAELRRHGVPVAARASYRLRGFSQVPSAQPAIDSAVLQFKSRQVDRVISFEPWVGWGFFMLAAERQGYYPTYGLSSQTAWAASYGTGLVPDDQLENAYYVGWSPVLDGVQTSAPWPRLLLCRSYLGVVADFVRRQRR